MPPVGYSEPYGKGSRRAEMDLVVLVHGRETTMKSTHYWATLPMVMFFIACSTPTKLEIAPSRVVLDGTASTLKLTYEVYDQHSNPIEDGADVVWFSEDTSIIKLSQNGDITALASGEATVTAEVVGTDLKAEVGVRVKIPMSVVVSHDKLNLWKGQVKENVYATVRSEKGAFIEGYRPTWSSGDPSIVSVEQIRDPLRRQSFVQLVGLKYGETYISASFEDIAQHIPVRVFDIGARDGLGPYWWPLDLGTIMNRTRAAGRRVSMGAP